jgi:hypothetical protein
VTQLIFGVQVIAASVTDERTGSLWMIGIEPVTACPALIHLDVIVTVIDHIRRTTFVAYHLTPPYTMLFVQLCSILLVFTPHGILHNRPQLFLAPFSGYLLEVAQSQPPNGLFLVGRTA